MITRDLEVYVDEIVDAFIDDKKNDKEISDEIAVKVITVAGEMVLDFRRIADALEKIAAGVSMGSFQIKS